MLECIAGSKCCVWKVFLVIQMNKWLWKWHKRCTFRWVLQSTKLLSIFPNSYVIPRLLLGRPHGKHQIQVGIWNWYIGSSLLSWEFWPNTCCSAVYYKSCFIFVLRHILAVVHFNFNLQREVKKNADGVEGVRSPTQNSKMVRLQCAMQE